MITIEPVGSVKAFIDAIWQLPQIAGGQRIYRGQAGDWELLPRLFRDRNKDPKGYPALESSLIQEFKARSYYLLPSVPTGRFDIRSLAQHYGLPTRLLDWTGNPLIALYFAIENAETPKPLVWVYNASAYQITNGKDLNIPESDPKVGEMDDVEWGFSSTFSVFKPNLHSPRVAFQAGWHTSHWMRFDPSNHKIWIVEPFEKTENKHSLARCMIDPHKVITLRKELRDIGIHAATVFGDVSSICKEIQDDLMIPAVMRTEGLAQSLMKNLLEHENL